MGRTRNAVDPKGSRRFESFRFRKNMVRKILIVLLSIAATLQLLNYFHNPTQKFWLEKFVINLFGIGLLLVTLSPKGK